MVARRKAAPRKRVPKAAPKPQELTVNPPGDVSGGTARYLVGDVFDALTTLAPNSVDLVVTSPPFLNLREYLPEGHPMKDKEIGREFTPAAFITSLLLVTNALGRVLAPHGTIVIELGDTYSNGATSTKQNVAPSHAESQDGIPGKKRSGRTTTIDEAKDKGFGGFLSFTKHGGDGWPQAKSLCGVPTLYAWSLAYGRNLLDPIAINIEPWIVRNLMVWCKPSAPVQELRDKFRASSSFITVATRSPDRYFDLFGVLRVDGDEQREDPEMFPNLSAKQLSEGFVVGAPPKDYLVINAKGFGGAHYATYPAELIEIPVDAMCPHRVCTVCGEPSRRVIESVRLSKDGTPITKDYKDGMDRKALDGTVGNRRVGLAPDTYKHTVRKHVGWTDCGHDAYRAGVVLDPFAGSGTTLAVATGRGRDAIGIDVDERNVDLARERVGPMLFSSSAVSAPTNEWCFEPTTDTQPEEDLW